jgi:PAS domain S-box-containing protein
MKDKAIQRILVFFALISAVLVVVAVDSARNITRSVASSDWVNHTHAVIAEANGVLSSLHVGEGAVLTFVVTGDAHSRTTAREAFAAMSEHLETAKALTRREAVQHAQVLQLEALTAPRVKFSQDVIAARQADQPETVRTLLAADAANEPLGQIQGAADQLINDEMALLAERDRASYLQAQTTRWTMWSGVALDVLLLGGVAWVIWDDMAARRRAAAVLEEANARLDAKVRERTAELASTNESLVTENFERRWANQALEHQLRYDRLIINSIHDLVFVLTKALNISRINPAVAQQTGWEPQDLANRPFASIVRLSVAEPGDAALGDPMTQALAAEHELRDSPGLLEDKRGRSIPVRVALYPLRDGDKVVGGVVILQIIRPTAPPPS